jgi:DNA-binding NtrC family response regulator
MSSSGAPRVLVLDGDASIRSLLIAIVEHMKYEAVIARDRETAIALAKKNDLTAAVIDVRENARELVERFTATSPSLHGNLILLTTLPPAVLENCSGVACVLRKPFQLDDLQRALRNCCFRG